MRRLLLPDAGPLFSFAAGDLLDLLLNFDLVISDVVKMKTIDRGSLPSTSYESARLAEFYGAHRQQIQIESTQLGQLIGNRTPKAHAGELSIQSLLIHMAGAANATILFEDLWFVRNRSSFHPSCVLMSTVSFLRLLEDAGLFPSAAQAEARIRLRRPHFLADSWFFTGGPT
ncbi:MAG: hypothetical protein V4476_11870 [Pseudomonadota bacterium]